MSPRAAQNAVEVVLFGVGFGLVLWQLNNGEAQELRRTDERKARQDERHRAKRLEEAVAERLAKWRKRIEQKAVMGE